MKQKRLNIKAVVALMLLLSAVGCGRYKAEITNEYAPSQAKTVAEKPKDLAPAPLQEELTPALPTADVPYVEPLASVNEEAERKPAVEKAKDYQIVEEGNISPTIYFNEVIYENETTCAEGEKKDLHGAKGVVLMKVCQGTLDRCGLQGSCTVVQNNKIYRLNILTQVRGQDRFFEIPNGGCIFGYGVDSICLDPFYTLAADMKLYKPGDVIFIPAAVGLELPNGGKHSGYFVIRDQGRGIVGKGRFDFFAGYYSWRDEKNPFLKLKLHDVNTKLPYYKITGDRAKLVLTSRAFPLIPKEK
ncbi:MAG: hypothetical protein BroJett040_05220 [Oligoflexia bacterium]|nr:MAG: hypothetical protein BroJett040_05220 [Oligoflexia bacterium]